jgi:hypothetical protein
VKYKIVPPLVKYIPCLLTESRGPDRLCRKCTELVEVWAVL